MKFANNESELYHWVPKGLGFACQTPQIPITELKLISQGKISTVEQEKLNQLLQSGISNEVLEKILDGFPDILESEREWLLDRCDYVLRRYGEMQDILYLKPLFISQMYAHLRRKLPDPKYRRVVDILLADPCVLFTDGDEHYRHRKINDESRSARAPLFYDAKRRRTLYNTLSIYTDKRFSEEDVSLCNAMLDRIFTMATEKHQNIQSWVDKNLPYNESDIAKNLIQLQELFPEYSERITPEFSENFNLLVLQEYVSKVAMAGNSRLRVDRLPISVDQKSAQLFVLYKVRLRRFEDLQSKALEQKKSMKSICILKLGRNGYFPCDADGHVKHEVEIIAAIQNFFMQFGSPLKDDRSDILRQRIVWVMMNSPRKLWPVILVYMTICCNRSIVVSTDCPMRVPPIFNCRYSKRKQRYFQLVLLNQLCDILSVSKENRAENWKQYIAWQGMEIQSTEEAQLWKQQLGTGYEQFPIIGFQLCCVDYTEDCIPLHLEYLSYRSTSKLHLGGYHTFWVENQEYIQLQAMDLRQQRPELLKRYIKFWKRPKEYFFESKRWLKEILEQDFPIDLSRFRNVPSCDEDELRRLILENELQICVTSDARLKLQKMCVTAYDLKRDLFTSFHQKGDFAGT